ncbi:OmpA family protein [Amycolatopsis nigrescens]|uniref:OmpA family protein n=1 Tax=Amycolatopsis nigrescens TaxID=381445 RepID=UPI00037F254B|nr:OmpA family protein [Amycolatopsis nigrescens]
MNRTAAFAVVLATLLPVLGGCGIFGSDEEPANSEISLQSCRLPKAAPLAIAVGARANVPRPELPSEVQELMKGVAGAHQPLTLIRLDGAPAVVFDEPPPPRAKNPTADKQAVAEYLAKAQRAFAERMTAATAQADVLAALSLGGRATAEGGTVVLVDSGLQTVKPLDFAKDGLLDADPAEVAEYLTEERLLPDLHGRTVILAGFGNTAPPQPDLDNNLRAKVVDTWRTAAAASGACVVTLPQPNTQKSIVDKPEVAVVAQPPAPDPEFCGTVELGESDNIAFEPDTATFRDQQAARETMSKFADAMRGDKRRAELIGTTATDGSVAGRLDLSARRAEAVKAVLVEQGVAADRITTGGVGTDWPGHLPDIGPDGGLLPGPAGQNRKVVMNLTCAD